MSGRRQIPTLEADAAPAVPDRAVDRATAPTIQSALLVGAANDPHEREADAVADEIVRRIRPPSVQRSVAPNPSEAPVVGLDGGAIDHDTSALITKRSGGRPLDRGIRGSMESAFGSDFSAVRIHDDRAAHTATDRLSARAFTRGRDVFFSKGSYRAGTASGERLLAHELTHVLQQGAAPTPARAVHPSSRGRVQRAVTYGTDPKAVIGQGDKDLMYGLTWERQKTKDRLDASQKNYIRTIDEYNKAIGINNVMKEGQAAIGLYDVRAELASAAWGLPRDASLDTATNQPPIQLWIDTLKQDKTKIGLEDLGAKAGFFSKNKIDKKGRFKKNRKASQASDAKANRLTSDDTRKYLSHGLDKASAQNDYDAMPGPKQNALNQWVYRAFFRRTSKLGQDFAIVKLGAKIHFNTVSDPDYDTATRTPGMKGMVDRGIAHQSKKRDNSKNRSITVSEYRHMDKLKKQHPNAFNEYGER